MGALRLVGASFSSEPTTDPTIRRLEESVATLGKGILSLSGIVQALLGRMEELELSRATAADIYATVQQAKGAIQAVEHRLGTRIDALERKRG